jgi:hypothetical protein
LGEQRYLCWRIDTFGGKETPLSKKRHFWSKRYIFFGLERYFWRNTDTCVGVETLFGGKDTSVSEKRHFWRKRDTYDGVETLLE